MSNSIVNQSEVNKLVANAIKHDLLNETVVKTALIHAIKLAASEIGRFDALNDLWKGVSAGTMENIRMYMVNLLRETGIEYMADNGKIRKVGFYNFNKTKLWNHPDAKTESYKQHRAIIDAMPIDDMMKIELGRVKTKVESDASEIGLVDFELRIARAIKYGLDNNLINSATANRFNDLIGEASRVDPEAIAKEAMQKIENMQKQAAKAGFILVKSGEPATINKTQTAKAA